MEKKKKKLGEKLRHKYRLIVYKGDTYEEVWTQNLSRLNIFAIMGGAGIVLIAIVTVLIAFTPLKEFIPGYPDGNMTYNIHQNASKLDSLEHQLIVRDQYFDNIKRIISGDAPIDTLHSDVTDTTAIYDTIKFEKSPEDSILREHVEAQDQYSLKLFDYNPLSENLNNINFFPPVRGIITGKFNTSESHYGVDIVAAPEEVITATLSGTVTLSTWTTETGYIMQIQHDNNLVSIYKHLSNQLKSIGNTVKKGEVIAIIGNSGEYSSGPHLHFELWHKGKPIDPEHYIVFN